MKVYHRVVAALVLAALAGPAVAKPPKVGQMAPNVELTLVDGGKGQAGIAATVLHDLGLHQVAVVGVAKGPERKPGLEDPVKAGGEQPRQSPFAALARLKKR